MSYQSNLNSFIGYSLYYSGCILIGYYFGNHYSSSRYRIYPKFCFDLLNITCYNLFFRLWFCFHWSIARYLSWTSSIRLLLWIRILITTRRYNRKRNGVDSNCIIRVSQLNAYFMTTFLALLLRLNWDYSLYLIIIDEWIITFHQNIYIIVFIILWNRKFNTNSFVDFNFSFISFKVYKIGSTVSHTDLKFENAGSNVISYATLNGKISYILFLFWVNSVGWVSKGDKTWKICVLYSNWCENFINRQFNFSHAIETHFDIVEITCKDGQSIDCDIYRIENRELIYLEILDHKVDPMSSKVTEILRCYCQNIGAFIKQDEWGVVWDL